MKTFKQFLVTAVLALFATACGAQSDQDMKVVQSDAGATYLIINFHVAQDHLDDFLPIMTGINEGMASEAGFVEAFVYRDSDNPLSFTLIEKWESRELHVEHYDRIVESGDWANILTMLTETPALRYTEKL